MNTLEIVNLTKETIYDTLIEEQINNPLFFMGDLEKVTATVVDNFVRLSFYPDVLAPAAEEQFFAKMGLLLHELKQFMIDQDYGAWLSTTITINNRTNNYFFTFNYDEFEAELDEYTGESYRRELELYPRKEAFIPDWMRERISQG
jgi:hypothetical protein